MSTQAIQATARPRALLMMLLGAAVLIGGCARDASDLEEFMSEVRARPPAQLDPIPEMRTFASHEYPADALRDPFRPPRQTARGGPGDGPRPDPERPREPLEQFALDSLRMMGTLERENVLWGLVRDTEGKVHRIREGQFLGQNHGRVIQIDQTRIGVRELIPDGHGGWLEREAALAIRD